MSKSQYALLTLLVLNLSAILYYFKACEFSDYCESTDGVFLLSEQDEKRALMRKAVVEAKGKFGNLFQFRQVPSTIMMDSGLDEPLPVRLRSQWRMVYDPTGAERLEDVLDAVGLQAEVDRFLLRLDDLTPENRNSVVSDPVSTLDTATHEVCHMFFHNMMEGKPFSDALDEVAAISCESQASIDRRLVEYKRVLKTVPPVEWSEFVRQQHPVKKQSDLVGAMNRASEESDQALEFTVDLGTELGSQIDLFYHQSAAFVDYWLKRCPNESILYDLALKMSEGHSFSKWLETNDFACSPSSLGEFERSLSKGL